MAETTEGKKKLIGCLVAIAFLTVFGLWRWVERSMNPRPAKVYIPAVKSAESGLVSIVGNIDVGVDVYGKGGDLVGRIEKVDPDYRDPVTGKKVRMVWLKFPDGHVEPKLWDSVLAWGFIKK